MESESQKIAKPKSPKFINGEFHKFCKHCKRWIPESSPVHTCYFADGESDDGKIYKDF